MPSTPSAPPPPAETNDFRRVLAGEGISNFGSMLSRLALPWLATLALDATPLQMALLLVADVAAGAAGALFLGTLVDRLAKRSVMIGADIARAGVLGGLALLALTPWLSIWLLAAAAALTGLLSMAFELARSAWVAQSVAATRLPVRNAQLSAMGSASETVAFALGGWLYQLLGAVLALAVDALSYLLSAACLWGVKGGRDRTTPPDPSAATAASAPAARRGYLDETLSGIAVIRATPQLRALATLEILLAVAGSIAGTSYMIYVARDLGFGTGTLGLIFASGGLGALAGAALAPRLGRRVGSGNAMTIGLVLGALGTLCIPLAPGATLVGAALLVAHQVVGDGGMTMFDVHDRTLRQTVVAPDMLARVDGGLRSLGRLATLVGALGGGALATAYGARLAIVVMVVLLALAAAVAHHRLRHQR
ncbi:MAG: MFS transporter [Burkholderiales bacterium]|nr:MFS transporter [Burkholderiales bacterium]